MIIKDFKKFKLFLEKDSTIYEFNCLMVYLNIPNWSNFINQIKIEELFDPQNERYGLESEPHCTILYGIHNDIADEEVISTFSNLNKEDFDLKVNGIDCFYNKDYDVLKMNVESEMLDNLNILAKQFPHTSNFPDYKPHITIGYLNKGTGNKYINPTFSLDLSNNVDRIVYSKTDGTKIDIPIH